MRRYSLILLFVLFSGFSAIASHIVGAELFYDYLGSNNYKITLRLYRNNSPLCNTCAPYGNPEYVQVFDASGNFIVAIPMAEPTPTNIPSNISNPCLVPDTNIIIEQAFYTATYNFPPIPGGYTLVYQRCCRNAAIQSIPTNTGATYVAHIANDSFPTNSSPRFTQLPPLFICADSYLQFDNSATDPDGDSLSYSLVNALQGASSACPDPSPAGGGAGCSTQASPPPYISVPYYSPYSATNPTNSPANSGDLQIDPVTGLLTGIPNQTGIFVVTVAVSEYRNGVYIDQTIRDYQFNIVVCNIPSSSLVYLPGTFNSTTNFGTYQLNCTSRTVVFDSAKVNFFNPPPTNIPLTYSWNFGVPGSTTDTSSQQFPTYTYPDSGTYLVTVVVSKTEGGQSCTDTAHALIVTYPTLTAGFTFRAGCQDSAVAFTDQSVSTSSRLSTWDWSFGDGQSSTLQNPTHQYASPGTYTVLLTAGNAVGCQDTVSATIVVDSVPMANFTASSLCVFETAHFLYTGTGSVTNYYWDFGNGGTSTLENPSEVYNTSGTQNVTLVTVSPLGCRDTITKPLVVNPLPVITPSANTTICPTTTTQLSASGAVSYVWSPGATLSDSVISDPVASPTASTTYYVVGTDANGCTNLDSVVVALYPVPQINAGPDTSVCYAGANFHTTVQLTATGGVSYVWTPATGLSSTTIANPIASPTANQTYYVTGTDANGCIGTDSITVFDLNPALNLIVNPDTAICDFDTITLNVLRQGDSYYVWTPTTGISDPNANSPFFYPTTTTPYIFTVQNYCYTKSDTAVITVHPLPAVATQGVDSVCIGGSDTLRATGASTYVWQPDPTLSATNIADPVATPTATDIYYVIGTDTFGCRKKDSVLVYVFYPPTVGIGPDTPYICQGKPIQLIATGGVDYQWVANSSLSSLTVANPIATPTDTTMYYVTIYNVHQCSAPDSIQVDVQLPVQAVAESPYNICFGSSVQLSASGGFYYQWSPPTWLSNPAISNPTATPDSTVVYTVTVSNNCFSSSASVDVVIHQLPVVNAGNDTLIYRNTSAILTGTTNGGNYFWYPGDTNSSILDPLSLTTPVTPLFTTTYYLYATSAFGCNNLDSVLVTVEPYTLVLLPSAFTPNGDGVNDLFHIVRFLNIEHLDEFAVYDRWGEKVYSTDIITDGWNGSYKGHPAEMGVYVWSVRARTYDGQDILKTGNVTLIR